MFVSLQIWPLFASKIIVSHICEELLSFNKEKKVCKNRIRFRPELLLSWPKKKKEKSFEFLDLNKRWSTGHIFAVPTKKLMRAKKFYFSCFVCRNTFRKLQTYWVKNQFVVHKFQFGTKIKKSEDLARNSNISFLQDYFWRENSNYLKGSFHQKSTFWTKIRLLPQCEELHR